MEGKVPDRGWIQHPMGKQVNINGFMLNSQGHDDAFEHTFKHVWEHVEDEEPDS